MDINQRKEQFSIAYVRAIASAAGYRKRTMKATIQDRRVLQSVQPVELIHYLRATSWTQVERHNGRYATWHNQAGDERIEILLPLDPSFRDYPTRIAEALHALAVAEDRSQLDILADIEHISWDVLRIGADYASMHANTLTIEQGASFVEHSSQLILAAACSTVHMREVFYARKPVEAINYIKKVRLGQSERGSYVLTILSPVQPAFKVPGQQDIVSGTHGPFERRVTQTLMHAIAAVREAAVQSAMSGEIVPFTESIHTGVSANLCDAIVGMQEGTDAHTLQFQMSWSPTRSVSATIPRHVVIASDMVPVIKEASSYRCAYISSVPLPSLSCKVSADQWPSADRHSS